MATNQTIAHEPRYKPGDRVRTPAHGVCEVDSLVHSRRANGQRCRERAYNMRAPGLTYLVWYYESDLKPA